MQKWTKICAIALTAALLSGTAGTIDSFAEQRQEDTVSAEALAEEAVNSLSPSDEIVISEKAGENGMLLTYGDDALTQTTAVEDSSDEEAMTGAGNLPSNYSSLVSGKVTDVLNQGSSNLCWALSGLDNAQIELLNKNITTRTSALYSAAHAAYAAYHGGGDTWKAAGGSSNAGLAWFSQGGNYQVLGSALARWFGAASENTYVTPTDSNTAKGFSLAANAFGDDLSHIDSYERLLSPNASDSNRDRDEAVSEIKQAVRTYGSVAIDYCSSPRSGSGSVYSSATNSFYDSEKDTPDHQVVIVGWDDEKRTAASEAGAFLIKNTWGAVQGEGGYSWLSYQDRSMVNPAVYHMEHTVRGNHTYSGNYYYDGTGYHRTAKFASAMSAANVFTAVRNERIAAIGTYIPANGSYTVSVITGITDGTPNTGSVTASASGIKENLGYYTIPLNREISVKKGEKFAVSVSVTANDGSGTRYYVFFEQGETNTYYDTVFSKGESYLTVGGTNWADSQNTGYSGYGNVCIKALTKGSEAFSFQPQQKNEETSASVTSASTVAMYRLYNPNSGEHFYTASSTERSSLIRAGWSDENIGWYAPSDGDPVYRLYNPNAGDHHYTKSAGERDALVKLGWNYEGVGWYSGGSVPLYRQYNPNAATGTHNYTKNAAERDNLIKLGWRDEGISWYGLA